MAHSFEPAASFFGNWRGGFWRRIIAASDSRWRRRFMALTAGLVAIIGVADFLTGFELSMLVFYLLPVCLAVMAADWRFGLATAVACVAVWLAGDFAAGAHYATPFVPVWNALIAMVTYVVVVWLLASVMALHRELEERVRQRTRSLTNEIAERERLEKALLEISEREQRSIGRDLHDGLGQHLTGAALVAQALGAQLAAQNAAESAEMAKVVGLIEQGIEQTRSLARGLLLAEIGRDGLVAAIEELASVVRSQFRAECEVRCDGNIRFEENGTATHIYRIAQEATRNASRHGRARQITIDLAESPQGFAMRVRDDGSGLPPADRRGQGLGLRIMAHRAAIIGASFTIGSPPEGGTLVELRLARHD